MMKDFWFQKILQKKIDYTLSNFENIGKPYVSTTALRQKGYPCWKPIDCERWG
jgi:hypothetical protein